MVTAVELVGLKAATNAFASIVVGRLNRVLESKYQSWKNIEMESTLLKNDLLILAADVDDQQRAAPRTAVARAYGEEIRELTHDIEDCIERFLHLITCKPGASWPRRSFHAIKTTGPRFRFAAKIKQLRNRVAEARKRALKAVVTEEAVQAVDYVPNVTPVGITEATMDLCKLLDVEANENEAEGTNIQGATRLRVVALVGFGGSGKTTLARVVYDKVHDEQTMSCAWVDGHSLENMDAKGILQNIHDQLGPGGMENRYLIVVDDIKDKHTTHWDTLKNAFRGNGRIIVTTTSRSIANKCSTCTNSRDEDRRSFGCVYTMRSLGKEDSKQIALLGRDTPELARGAEELLKQCGGLPLALYSVASRLSCENELTGKSCNRLCNNLGSYLECEDDEPNFAKLRGVLRENYTSLSDYTVRTCLLYLGIFPMDHPFKKNVIIRRWLAEGYARHDKREHQTVAEENFEIFMNRSIILPVVPTSDDRGKTCKTNSIMHVFMLHTSMSKKFIMPFCARHKKVRHFFIHGRNGANFGTMANVDLSRVRSLTVLGNAGNAISNFSKYKLARVLDLEGCTDVEDHHVKGICKLWNLRYLSLGPKITEIPKEIAQLKLLETLDVSKTRVNLLPVEAIGLPCLIHLIGKFKFQDPVKTERLPRECMLETVAGFIADKGQGFLQLMDRMKRLNKVKIWCASDETGQGQVDMNNHLSEAIQKYIEAPMDEGTVRSLSLHFQGLPQGSLTALDQLCQNHSLGAGHSYHLTSLKLHGNSSSATLSNFLPLFCDLTKLSISTTTMSVTHHLLSVLGKIPFLLCLKITANSIDGGFVIHDREFMSLNRLCLVLKVVGMPALTIKDEARPQIISLQLICKGLVGLSGADIMPLSELKEIALHPDVVEETREAWEAEASNHHNKPYVVSMSIPGVHGEPNSSEEETNNMGSTKEPTHEDHIIRQEPAAIQEEPAHEDHIIQEESAEIEEKPAAVKDKPAHDDHIIQEESAAVEEKPAAVEEKAANDNHIIREEPAAATSSNVHFANSIGFNVNGAQEAGGKEAASVLGAA